MSRLIIDISSEQHQKIKVLAALQGKTIKDYVLEKIFPKDANEDQAWEELTELLTGRIEDAENNPPSKKSFEQLTKEIIQKRKTQ
tara:strand:- start:2585 stop:2839 length:255 start_codon:yes stop_codon:yes gene_type:complete